LSTENAQRPNSDGAEANGRSSVRRGRSEAWWMISREGAGGVEPLALGHPSTRALALFGFAEEAELYLCLAGIESDGWGVRESGPGEVASMLFGPCAGVKLVALDPLPGMAPDGGLGSVCTEKSRFLARLLGAGIPGRCTNGSLESRAQTRTTDLPGSA
jgi:hypothetical protein